MTIIQNDVKLVYGGVAGDINATPPGAGGAGGVLGAGFPQIQGTTAPPVTLFRDFNDGTSNDTLGITIADDPNFGQLPFRKHSWAPTDGIGGTGAIRMNWFTGMGIGFSPVWITTQPAPASRTFRQVYFVRQNAIMDIPGSNVKLNRIRLGGTTLIGTLVSGGGGSPARPLGGFRFFLDDWNPGTVAISSDVTTPIDDLYHKYDLFVDYSNINQLFVEFKLDDVVLFSITRASQQGDVWAAAEAGGLIMSPFAETFSCGNSGCQAFINNGDYWVDNFAYTIE